MNLIIKIISDILLNLFLISSNYKQLVMNDVFILIISKTGMALIKYHLNVCFTITEINAKEKLKN